jgi:FdhD protein
MRTPGDDESLVRGLLHSEGILSNTSFKLDFNLSKEKDTSIITTADLSIPESELGEGYANSRSLLSVSSCGICGRTEIEEKSNFEDKIDSDESVDLEFINQLFEKMSAVQHNFLESGGTHAAAAFNSEGKLLCSMEDIGRHNAVDKVIGELILQNKLNQASCITVSGRVSYEIVIKCFKARIPFLAAVSAPSTLAVDYAEELGISLFAFCRDNRATCYSNPQRLKTSNQNLKAS